MSGLSELLDIEEQTINRWKKDKAQNGNRPAFNAVVKMLRKGATVETLFGVDYAKAHQRDKAASTEERKPIDLDSPEFQAAVKSAIVDLKTKGLI